MLEFPTHLSRCRFALLAPRSAILVVHILPLGVLYQIHEI
jgi:hypothetical protein